MRRATLLAAGALVLGSLGVPALAAPDDVPDTGSAELDRVQGETRYHTAADTAVTAHPDGVDTVLVATGENFPDALAASYLAGSDSVDSPYPILLTHPTFLPGPTSDAIQELGASNVIILGQTTAVSGDVERELEQLVDGDVARIGGDDRVQTAARIAERGGDVGTAPNLSDDASEEELATVIVARADNFPDALASGPLALEGRHPILLTDVDRLPAATRDILTGDLGIEQVIIAGGPSAVNESVEAEIADLDNIESVARVQGEVRTETAVRMAELTRAALGWSPANISLARGDLYPDALTLAPLAAMEDASMYLTGDPGTLSAETFRGIQEICEENERILISGGPDAVSEQAAGEAKQASLCATEFAISHEQSVGDAGKPGAEGTGWYTVVGDTICVAYDVDGLEGMADASHIHEGAEGETGDVVVDLGAPNPQGFLATCVTDADQAAAITADPTGYYVNVHTTDYPSGAARGQLVEPEPAQEEPPVELTEEFSVFGDAVLGDTGVAGYTASATLEPGTAPGELCLTLSDEDPATTAAAAQLFEGAVDQGPQGDAIASWTDITEGEQSCTEVTDPAVLAAPFQGDQFHLSVDDVDGDEIARGQVQATADAQLTDESDQDAGVAMVFRGADATVLCGAVEVTSGDTPNGDAVVNDASDTEVATFTFDAQLDYDCDDDGASEEDPASITVPTDGDTLTGAFDGSAA